MASGRVRVLPDLPGNRKGEVKDAAQVRTIARWLRDLDRKNQLAAYFEGPRDLTAEQRRQVEQEEGWILGVL